MKRLAHTPTMTTFQLPVLLITSSIRVSAPLTALTDPAVRLAHTLDALRLWVAAYPTLQVVVCDGSNFDLTAAVQQQMPQASVECLSFENDQEQVARKGKGWGEGEIVRHALRQSATLQVAKAFAKCTSKLFVRNLPACLDQWNGTFLCDARFGRVSGRLLPQMELRWLDTRFYVTDKAFYLNALLDAHQGVDDLGGRHLEHCFLQAVLAAKVSRFVFSTPPAIAGVSGSSGREAVSGTHSRAARARRLALGWTTNWVTR